MRSCCEPVTHRLSIDNHGVEVISFPFYLFIPKFDWWFSTGFFYCCFVWTWSGWVCLVSRELQLLFNHGLFMLAWRFCDNLWVSILSYLLGQVFVGMLARYSIKCIKKWMSLCWVIYPVLPKNWLHVWWVLTKSHIRACKRKVSDWCVGGTELGEFSLIGIKELN